MARTRYRLGLMGSALAAVVGMTFGAAAARVITTDADVTAALHAPVNEGLSHEETEAHGEDGGQFRLTVEPLAVIRDDQSAHVDFDVSIESNFEGQSAFIVSSLVVNERGDAVGEVRTAPPLVAAARSAVSATISTPQKMNEGAYALRIIVAGADTKSDATSESDVYFRIKGGDITLMDINEWRSLPTVSEGREVAAESEGTKP